MFNLISVAIGQVAPSGGCRGFRRIQCLPGTPMGSRTRGYVRGSVPKDIFFSRVTIESISTVEWLGSVLWCGLIKPGEESQTTWVLLLDSGTTLTLIFFLPNHPLKPNCDDLWHQLCKEKHFCISSPFICSRTLKPGNHQALDSFKMNNTIINNNSACYLSAYSIPNIMERIFHFLCYVSSVKFRFRSPFQKCLLQWIGPQGDYGAYPRPYN